MQCDAMFVPVNTAVLVNANRQRLTSLIVQAGLLALAVALALPHAQAQISADRGAVATDFTSGQDQAPKTSVTYSYRAINFPGAANTLVYAINNQAELVGYYTGAGCSQTSCGFTRVVDTYTSVECAGKSATNLFDISNNGEIVGTYTYSGGVAGFILQANGSCSSIADPSGSSSTEAWGVNSSGEVV